ncbi:MAG: hypothetical protein HOM14_03885 [Gammaproteobacteria bacterium]|jgi:hypothetical protein|nr:hypothetical protein [Gammaproteobacteria bacterium]MBT4194809.1 hypothetical protein [Gammaproteobacteria bacterium]MBT6550476.1 hypothetical protein [Gammaproteobacteria bacterium]
MANNTNLNYLAGIIYTAFQNTNNAQGLPFAKRYLAEKKSRLAEQDKFASILFLHQCDPDIQSFVAKRLEVSRQDLLTAIQVVGRC